jgi:ketosteroid isomerase-like protein
MLRTSGLCIIMLLVFLATLAWGQASSKPATAGQQASSTEDFASAVKRVRQTWVQEFNAGHADKVAALYAEEAVMMRRNGSVHSRDSIQAELERSIATAQGHNYTVESLHTEHSGDLGYDTGIYNEDFPRHVSEGNYLIVLKRIQGEWKITAHAAIPNPRMK